MKLRIFIMVFALVLSGCFGSVARYQPQQVNATGMYTHQPSGSNFPEEFEGFYRVSITKFDERENDIGVGYNHKEMPIALTLYIYPEPKVLSFGSPKDVIDLAEQRVFENEFERSVREILLSHQNSKLVTRLNYTLHQSGYRDNGLFAEFSYVEDFAGKYQSLNSQLYLFHIGSWIFKYRATYPETINAKPQIENFMLKFPMHQDT
ncbi:hypothetical protein [Gynuella sp.]|uniref:hypothetical protein n=1 Tax=Gynuella sp. TaxID=2969146 RepID=UPI003D0C27ED